MFWPKLLPWEYGVRNLFRRPWRTALTLCALTLVMLLVLVVAGFVRGLEAALTASGDPQVVLVYAVGMGENLEYSAVPASTADLLRASLESVRQRYGVAYVSPELYLATRIAAGARPGGAAGLVRGVTPAVFPVRRPVEITAGTWPSAGEILVGRLAATKLGCPAEELTPGRSVQFEGRPWRISGSFTAGGSMLESECWCRLEDLQQALKRQDLSLVALGLEPGRPFSEVDLFCKQRLDLQLQASRETQYYAALRAHYRPVRILAWMVTLLLAGAGIFAAINTMYAAVIGRVRELAALQTIGFTRRAITLSIVQEALLLAAAATLAAALIAVTVVHGAAIRFTMGAFALRIDSTVLLVGGTVGLLLGLLGALPPAVRAMRLPIAEGLRAI